MTLDPHRPCPRLPHLPHDILYSGILTRLPVKSLCRFRCVSKLWNATITDPHFCKSHLIFAKQNSTSSILGLYYLETNDRKTRNYHFLTKDDPHFYRFQTHSSTKLIGYSNGLFCFRSRHHIILFNPCTREFLHHPLPPPPPPNHPRSYGFGFDPLRNEYKAVQIVYASRSFYRCMAYTFGAENNSWREIALELNPSHHFNWCKLPDDLTTEATANSGMALYVKGTLFWFFRSSHLFMAFNLHRESVTFFQGPTPESALCDFFQKVTCRCILIEWQGCMCLAFQNIVGNIVHLYTYKPTLPDADAWHVKMVDLRTKLILIVGALGGESLLYSFKQNRLILYAEGLDGRFHNWVGSKLATKFPRLSGVHYDSVIQYQFAYHVENRISLKTLLKSSPTRVQHAKTAKPVPAK